MDIIYIPMARECVYLAVVVDWYSRRILSWRLSITLTVDFCLAAVEDPIWCHGTPEVFNTDQGSQFTCTVFTELLKLHAIRISMDGKGCWRGNVIVEKLWRTIKYNKVYLKAYESVSDARANLGHFIEIYNLIRPHSSLAYQTPDEVYYGHRLLPEAA